MSSYPGPISILPIFNSQEFNYSSSSLSISTADKRYLRLTGGILSGLLTANGNVNTPSLTLTGTGTPASFANIKLNAYDTINNYLQFNLQNLSSGSSASTDIICTNNNGNDTAGFIDMGINSTTNSSTIGGVSDAYLYTIADLSGNGGNLFLGTQSSKTLYLFANTSTPSSSNSITWNGSSFNVPGIATFTTTNGVPGGQAVQINSLTNPYVTRLYSTNNSFSTDLYFPQFNGIDTLVSTASTQNLTNKTISASKFGSNGTTITLTQFGRASISASTGTVTFPNAFASTPTVSTTLEQSNTGYVFVIQVTSVSTTGFTWRQYGMTIAAGSTVFAAGDPATIHWVASA